jgi:hypothetical protein
MEICFPLINVKNVSHYFSSVKTLQHSEDGARGLCLTTFGPTRARGIIPGIDIKMCPGLPFRYEATQKQSGCYRASHGFLRNIGQISEGAIQPGIIAIMQGQAPHRVLHYPSSAQKPISQRIIIAEKRR